MCALTGFELFFWYGLKRNVQMADNRSDLSSYETILRKMMQAGFFDEWREVNYFHSIPIYLNLEPQPISVSDHASLTVGLT